MTDYHPLIVRAVAGLDKNTGESRRGLYDRARTALVAQLRGLNPPLTESEITRERLALEEAIRKVEAEASRRNRAEHTRPDPKAPAKPVEAPEEEEKPQDLFRMPPPAPQRAPSGDGPALGEKLPTDRDETAPPTNGAGRRNGDGPEPKKPGRPRLRAGRAPLLDERLKGDREILAETDGLGGAVAEVGKSSRLPPGPVPTDGPELDGGEPRGSRPSVRDTANRRPNRQPPPKLDFESDEPLPSIVESRSSPPRPLPSRPENAEEDDDLSPRKSWTGLAVAAISVLAALTVAIMLFWQRDRIRNWVVKAPSPQHQQASAPTQSKLPDRVTQNGQAPAVGGQNDVNAPAVAQRVVLYEEDPADAQGKRYVGSVVWRTETVTPGVGQNPELEVRSDLEIPERRITMTMALRRNTDKSLPASHTIEIMFNLPADFPFGGISNVPGILMKQAEQTRGAPLAGLAVKVTSGFFLVGLSSADADMQRNLQLLKERSWFDIPIVYNNGRRAILAVEKGTPGERAFNEAFAAWGE